MNLIDLRNFEFKIEKIVSFKDNKIIFSSKEYADDKEGFKIYFYKYNVIDKTITTINSLGIDTCESAAYSNIILNNNIYTNSYITENNETETSIYKINIEDGDVQKLYSTKKDAGIIFLSERYIILRGNNFEIDDEHSDVQKDIEGEYDYAILCDLKCNKEYNLKDKRVVLGIRDYFLPYSINGSTYIVFEEAYMEDWELEEDFEKRLQKEDFYMNAYRESLNIISLDNFIKEVKNEYKSINFNEIHKTELTANTRYLDMDEENIYYRVKDFKSKIQSIYSVNKKTLEKKLLKSIEMNNNKFSYSKNYVRYNIVNKEVYRISTIDNKIKSVNEVYKGNFKFEYIELNEDFEGVIDDYLITSFWTEDDNGDNFKNFIKIRDVKSGNFNVYEGNCIINKDNVILFK